MRYKKHEFENSDEAFKYYYDYILLRGMTNETTKFILNCGFWILNPRDNHITTRWRKWKPDYARLEWDWYLSGDRNAEEISKHAQIWKNCMDGNGNVNSNYGYQWNRGGQLDYVVNELKRDPNSRRAVISIYDGKEHLDYNRDTPCTLAITFTLIKKRLHMNVLMRSNDLVYGFCNDQYCFSNLQYLIAERLDCGIGTYYHFTTNMHIYERHYNLKNNFKKN